MENPEWFFFIQLEMSTLSIRCHCTLLEMSLPLSGDVKLPAEDVFFTCFHLLIFCIQYPYPWFFWNTYTSAIVALWDFSVLDLLLYAMSDSLSFRSQRTQTCRHFCNNAFRADNCHIGHVTPADSTCHWCVNSMSRVCRWASHATIHYLTKLRVK